MEITVEIARAADAELTEAFGRLLPQLSRTARPLDAEAVARVVASDTNTVLVARADGEIVGTLTLTTTPLPSGLRPGSRTWSWTPVCAGVGWRGC